MNAREPFTPLNTRLQIRRDAARETGPALPVRVLLCSWSCAIDGVDMGIRLGVLRRRGHLGECNSAEVRMALLHAILRRRVLSRRGASELELSQKRSAADFLKRGDSCSEVPL